MMRTKPYGNSGFSVSTLGFGAGQIGDDSLGEANVATLLNTALDMGITLIDTARGYGLSEERIGRHLAHRRSEYILSTKVGYGIDGFEDWTGDIIEAGVDAALKRLNTEVIDIVHLHSCAVDTLVAGDVVDALVRCRDKGKIRVAAYSGDNEALAWAVDSTRFGGAECSVNIFDQANLLHSLPRASSKAIGVIAKRALGNAPWRFPTQPVGDYCEIYWQRMHALAYDTAGLPWDEFALRFTAHHPAIDCAIVGTRSIDHLRHNVEIADKGPLPDALSSAVIARFGELGARWQSEI
jgi:aryl-alcohol dehydrogenase-like predicted oxidoreductase